TTKDVQTFTATNGLESGTVLAIFEAADGAMWFGTGNGGVSRLDRRSRPALNSALQNPKAPTAIPFTTFGLTDGLVAHYIKCIAQDADGTMWFAGDPGLVRYDGRSFVSFDRADGLAGLWVRGIHFDAHGGIWIGTVDGLSHFDQFSCAVLGQQDGLDT